jgi:hypothetical protein
MALWHSVEVGAVVGDHVDVGSSKYYAPYVSQGTYDYAMGYGPWTEADAREFDSLTDTGDGPGVGLKGMKARPFLVNGLLDARRAIRIIWEDPIN